MGIQGLWPHLRKLAKAATGESPPIFRNITDLSRFDAVYIDAPLYLNRYAYSNNMEELPWDRFKKLTEYFLSRGVKPVYVFDGMGDIRKQFERERRENGREKRKEKAHSLTNLVSELHVSTQEESEIHPGVTKVAAAALSAETEAAAVRTLGSFDKTAPIDDDAVTRLSPQQVSAVIDLATRASEKAHAQAKRVPDVWYEQILEHMYKDNMSVEIADVGDAEAWAARLAKSHGKCGDGLPRATVVTSDGDALAYGAPSLLRENDFKTIPTTEGTAGWMEVNLEACLRDMGLTYSQFVDLCVMSGCDFTAERGLPRVGPAKATKILQSYGTLKRYLESEKAPSSHKDLGPILLLARDVFISGHVD